MPRQSLKPHIISPGFLWRNRTLHLAPIALGLVYTVPRTVHHQRSAEFDIKFESVKNVPPFNSTHGRINYVTLERVWDMRTFPYQISGKLAWNPTPLSCLLTILGTAIHWEPPATIEPELCYQKHLSSAGRAFAPPLQTLSVFWNSLPTSWPVAIQRSLLMLTILCQHFH